MKEETADPAVGVLSHFLENLKKSTPAPGIAAGISAKGRRLEAFSGVADLRRKTPLGANSRFGIACVAKLLTAILVMKLETQGLLSTDDSAGKWLEPLGLGDAFDPETKLAHLLTHTSGLQGPLLFGVPHRLFAMDRLTSEIDGFCRLFPPGRVFNYENIGHVLVSRIVSDIVGMPIPELFSQEIFEPLGIVPGNVAQDFKDKSVYVAPHRLIDGSEAQVVAPAPFGPFWAGSLSDVTLTIADLLTLGEAIVQPGARFNHLLPTLMQRRVKVPETVSGQAREHAPRFFNLLCAEYNDGWFGYAGSPPGQTIGFRFNPKAQVVTAVAVNAWLPIARDFLLDRLTGSVTHPEAGKPQRVAGVALDELTGSYRGGGNIIRMAEVKVDRRLLRVTLGPEGLTSPEFTLEISQEGDLVPEPASRNPALGFFRSPGDGGVCMFVGSAALRRVHA